MSLSPQKRLENTIQRLAVELEDECLGTVMSYRPEERDREAGGQGNSTITFPKLSFCWRMGRPDWICRGPSLRRTI